MPKELCQQQEMFPKRNHPVPSCLGRKEDMWWSVTLDWCQGQRCLKKPSGQVVPQVHSPHLFLAPLKSHSHHVCVCVCVCVLVTELCTTLCNLMDYIAQQSSWISKNMWKFYPWNSPSKNTGVGWHFLLQGIIWPRDQTQVSCIGGRFLTVWATDWLHVWLVSMSDWSALIGLHVSGLFHPFCRPGSSHLGCCS